MLNAADPIVAGMAANCPRAVTFFAVDRDHPVMATHRAQGKRVVYVENDAIVVTEGKMSQRISLAGVPITRKDTISFQVENVMASVAAAWAVGLTWDAIRNGLASFVNDSDNAPGRFNVFDYKGGAVIADYGHNPDAMLALVRAVEGMPAKRRTLVMRLFQFKSKRRKALRFSDLLRVTALRQPPANQRDTSAAGWICASSFAASS